jgi:hypothetical protein
MFSGRLKAFTSLSNWYSEFRLYRRDQEGRVVKEHDHLMDAMRYLIMSGRDRMRTTQPRRRKGEYSNTMPDYSNADIIRTFCLYADNRWTVSY